MSYSAVKTILRDYLAENLEALKQSIDLEGPLPAGKVEIINQNIGWLDDAIVEGRSEMLHWLGDDIPEELKVDHRIQGVLKRYELEWSKDSTEYKRLTTDYNRGLKGMFEAWLEHNERAKTYDFSSPEQSQPKALPSQTHKPEYRLSNIIEAFLTEMRSSSEWEMRTEEDRVSSLEYIKELLGDNTSILEITAEKARYVKSVLMDTPTNRNKHKETKGKHILDQVAVEGMEKLSTTTINKYLQCYSLLFNWAKDNKYLNDNPFAGMKVKGKSKETRKPFSHDEIILMLSEIAKGKKGLAKSDTVYWGSLIAIYTGARLNEIASLTPEDIKQDSKTSIWYFDINDEEEAKKLKTNASKRLVPVHSKLIELGLLDYVESVKSLRRNNNEMRLLYDLTYSPKEGWGRKLGRWFNDQFLVKLEIKTDKKSLHSLRHSFISHLDAKGINGPTLSALVGHEANTVTSRVYTHRGVEHLPVYKDSIENLKY